MTKITKLVAKTFEGKPSGFTVTFDDNRTGNLQEKESDKGLREGDTVIVKEIPYTSKAGKTSTLYGVRLGQSTSSYPAPPQPQNPSTPNKPSVPTSSLGALKAKATTEAMGFMVDCFIADKFTWDQIKEKHKELTGYLNDAIDECNS